MSSEPAQQREKQDRWGDDDRDQCRARRDQRGDPHPIERAVLLLLTQVKEFESGVGSFGTGIDLMPESQIP